MAEIYERTTIGQKKEEERREDDDGAAARFRYKAGFIFLASLYTRVYISCPTVAWALPRFSRTGVAGFPEEKGSRQYLSPRYIKG